MRESLRGARIKFSKIDSLHKEGNIIDTISVTINYDQLCTYKTNNIAIQPTVKNGQSEGDRDLFSPIKKMPCLNAVEIFGVTFQSDAKFSMLVNWEETYYS